VGEFEVAAGVLSIGGITAVRTDEFCADWLAVDPDTFVAYHDFVAGKADDTLDPAFPRGPRGAEYDDIAALGLTETQDLGVDTWQPNTIRKLTHHDEVTGLEGRHHRTRWNTIGLSHG
jgi:hypothetical protein